MSNISEYLWMQVEKVETNKDVLITFSAVQLTVSACERKPR